MPNRPMNHGTLLSRTAGGARLALAGLALLACPLAVQAQEEDLSKVEIKVTKVAGTVYLLQGSGGNMAASVGEDGTVLIDDEFAPLAPKIKAAIEKLTKKPVRTLINTHWHGDHTGGNLPFSEFATILAHGNVRKRMAAGANIFGREIPPAPAQALPSVTYEDKVMVYANGEEIRVVHQPPGHTDGDSIIYFTKANVVHMGDDFVTYGFPFVDVASGGSVKGMADNLAALIPTLPADAKIIPGHGPLSTVEDVKKFTAALQEMIAAVQSGIGKRKTLEDLKKEKVLSKWASWDGGFLKADQFLELIYTDLTKH